MDAGKRPDAAADLFQIHLQHGFRVMIVGVRLIRGCHRETDWAPARGGAMVEQRYPALREY
jgi:hypothetical protein